MNTQNKDGETALILACKNGKSETVKMLIAKGCDKEIKDNDGLTAIMWASKCGNSECLKLLLNGKVDDDPKVTKMTNNLKDVIAYGKEIGEPEIIATLLKDRRIQSLLWDM